MYRLKKCLLALAAAGGISLLTAAPSLAASMLESVQGIETGAGSIGSFVTPYGLLPCGAGHSCFSGVAQGQLQGSWSTDVAVQTDSNGLPANVVGGTFFLTTQTSTFSGAVDPANIAAGPVVPLGWGLCEQSFTITPAGSLSAPSVAITHVTLKHYGYLIGATVCHAVAATIGGYVTLSTT